MSEGQLNAEQTASLGTQFLDNGEVIWVLSLLWKQWCVSPALGPLHSHGLWADGVMAPILGFLPHGGKVLIPGFIHIATTAPPPPTMNGEGIGIDVICVCISDMCKLEAHAAGLCGGLK